MMLPYFAWKASSMGFSASFMLYKNNVLFPITTLTYREQNNQDIFKD